MRKETFICDRCKQPVGDLYGPLIVSVQSPVEPDVNTEKDFCSLDCFKAWACDFERNPQP